MNIVEYSHLRDLTNAELRTIIDVEREHGRAFGHRAEAARLLLELRGSRSAVAAPRCVVCGGPDAAGNGCEHCPGYARER